MFLFCRRPPYKPISRCVCAVVEEEEEVEWASRNGMGLRRVKRKTVVSPSPPN